MLRARQRSSDIMDEVGIEVVEEEEEGEGEVGTWEMIEDEKKMPWPVDPLVLDKFRAKEGGVLVGALVVAVEGLVSLGVGCLLEAEDMAEEEEE